MVLASGIAITDAIKYDLYEQILARCQIIKRVLTLILQKCCGEKLFVQECELTAFSGSFIPQHISKTYFLPLLFY